MRVAFLTMAGAVLGAMAGPAPLMAQTVNGQNVPQTASMEQIQALGAEFWAWRAISQPTSSDDIPRIARPPRWLPDWSPRTVERQRARLAQFEVRWRQLADSPSDITEQVDYQLIGSALARVRWELDHVAAWRRQPHFYVAQSIGPVFEVLLPPPPVESDRIEQVIRLLENVPAVLSAGEENLDDMRGPFVTAARAQLAIVPDSLQGMAGGLDPFADAAQRQRLHRAVDTAVSAFADFDRFLREAQTQGKLPQDTAVGRDSYAFFLNDVALYPFSPEQIAQMGRQAWARSVLFEQLESNRNAGMAELPIARSVDDVIARLHGDERDVRAFLEQQNILTVPEWVGHYNASAFPDYLRPIGWLGRTFDISDPARRSTDATVYLPDPSPGLGYFNLSIARDPRPIIVHEGVPGHFFQLSLGWRHPDPLRRYYYDSGANEGTGYYAEEMMLQAGYWDDDPKTREVIQNFARLRALRVEVDVKLALGEFTISDAADYLEAMVPMDRATAEEEAVFFAAAPGQAISYQIGKLQTTEFLAEARVRSGNGFNLRQFHDYLWQNGNVPIALLKEEYFAKQKEK